MSSVEPEWRRQIAAQRSVMRPSAAREWERWDLSGPTSLDLDGTTFRLPLGARVKHRAPLFWVMVRDLVYVISPRGSLDLTLRERLDLAEKWDRI